MQTSYFSKVAKDPLLLQRSVAICLRPPDWLPNIRVYDKLAPDGNLLYNYKNKFITKEEYTTIFCRDILDFLDPQEVFSELGDDSILCCWESNKTNMFCHRHLVARWLEQNLGIIVKEVA